MERIKNTAGRVERKEARIDPWGRGRVKIVFPERSGSLTERIGDISRREYSPRRRRRSSSIPAIVVVVGSVMAATMAVVVVDRGGSRRTCTWNLLDPKRPPRVFDPVASGQNAR